MDASKLVLMVNQIDKNIPFDGVHSDVIAAHLKKFWTPAMRADIYSEVTRDSSQFSQDVIDAVTKLHSEASA